MIDYLTPLLEGEPEVDGRSLVWPVGTAPVPWDGDEASQVSAAARESGGDLASAAVQRLEAEGSAADSPDRAPAWPEEVRQRRTGAAELDRKLRQTGRLSRLAETGGTALTVALPERAQPAGAADLLDWDRAVRRDARRYDSGFTLY